MAKSKIEWTDQVWNPVTGCDKISQGCKNCYAGRLAETRLKHLPEYKDGFYGNVQLHPERITQPLKWKKPRKVFVNSMSDLFHEDVPFSFIDSVYEVMGYSQQHIFQILTKRPQRALEYYNWTNIFKAWDNMNNVWLGVSVEDQAAADERIPVLLKMPAAVRFISCEPLLGLIDLIKYLIPINESGFADYGGPFSGRDKIDWIIAGGESGHSARPMHPDWVRSIRNQCSKAKVPFFFKQWGEWLPHGQSNFDTVIQTDPDLHLRHLSQNTHGWYKVGRNKTGRLLDGKLHNEYPKINTGAIAV